MKRVAVLGAGVAGVAAAWAAQRDGAHVVVYDGGPGASRLTSGALDARWSADEPPLSMTDELRVFIDALSGFVLPERRCLVATSAGLLRSALGADASLLNLTPLAGKTVAVALTQRHDLDAHSLARGLSHEPDAQRRALRFIPVSVDVLRFEDERSLPSIDLAARHDDEARLRWLAARITDVRRIEPFDALLLGPWLGATRPRAPWLSSLAGLPVGELLSGPGAAAGRRLSMALGALRASTHIETIQAQVSAQEDPDGGWRVNADEHAARFDALILATGGLASGGIVFERPLPDDVAIAPPRFVMTALDDATLLGTSPTPGSPSPAMQPLTWSAREPGLLDRVGVLHQRGQVLDARGRARRGLFVAGDAALGVSRTWLAAASSGLEAGRAAAR